MAKEVKLRQGFADVDSVLPQSVATTANPQFNTIELGAATDTTISRTGAGVIAVEGAEVITGNPVSVAKGGTGQTTEAEALGEMIQALTQDTTPLPEDFLVTYDASADTGKKVALGNSGGLQLLTSGSVSGATLSLVLTSYTTYRGFRLLLDIIPATDNTALNMLLSTNGGSSYDNAAGNYAWINTETRDTPTTNNNGSSSSSVIQIIRDIGNASNEGVHVWLEMMKQTSTAYYPRVSGNAAMMHSSGAPGLWNTIFSGMRLAAQDTDAWRFQMSSGNFTSGSYALYGYH